MCILAVLALHLTSASTTQQIYMLMNLITYAWHADASQVPEVAAYDAVMTFIV